MRTPTDWTKSPTMWTNAALTLMAVLLWSSWLCAWPWLWWCWPGAPCECGIPEPTKTKPRIKLKIIAATDIPIITFPFISSSQSSCNIADSFIIAEYTEFIDVNQSEFRISILTNQNSGFQFWPIRILNFNSDQSEPWILILTN